MLLTTRLMIQILTRTRYLPDYPLVCLAAQFSERVYTKPTGKERETHVDAEWRMGTKAMVIKSIPIDDQNAVVFAIRGTQTFMLVSQGDLEYMKSNDWGR